MHGEQVSRGAQAAVATIESEGDIEAAIAEIVANKRVSKARHPAMYAWRLPTGAAGHADGGESGSGKRLLALLQKQGREGVLVAVTRWYGGSPLGPARFRAIISAAKDGCEQADRLAARYSCGPA